MKAYSRVVGLGGGGSGTHYPGVDCPHVRQANIDYAHRDKIGEIVSSIFLKGFQKFQITRLFSIPFIITTNQLELVFVKQYAPNNCLSPNMAELAVS